MNPYTVSSRARLLEFSDPGSSLNVASTLVGVKNIDGSVELARKQFVNGISTAETQYEKNVKSSRM